MIDTTYKAVKLGAVIDSPSSIRGRNRFNRIQFDGPFTVRDIRQPYSDWNSGLVQMDLLIKAFDTDEMWITVCPSDPIRIIFQGGN